MIEFKKRKSLIGGFDYEACGYFRKDVTFIRATKNKLDGDWSLIIFKNDEPKGELYCKCKSLSDCKETATERFSHN